MAERMGDVVTAYLAELKEAGDELVTVACVVTSARKHITKEKKLMMFAQVEDLTGSVEATIFPRTYELTAPVWNTDEILLVLGRVEKRDEAPKILVEHAVRFDDQGMRDIKRVASETAERLARRSRFVRPGAMGAAPWGPAPAAGAPRRPTALTSTNGHGNGAGVSSARPSSEEQPSAVSPPGASPASPGASSADVAPSTPRKPTELVIRFREALDYERSIEIFKRIQHVLADYAGQATVVLELPRASGAPRRVATSFRTTVSADVAEAVEREVGKDVVEVVIPE